MNAFLMVRLLLAHIVGDFFLQWDGMCERKKMLYSCRGWSFQVLHALIYTAAIYLFVAEWTSWKLFCFVFFTHIIVDVAKSAIDGHVKASDQDEKKMEVGDKSFLNSQKLWFFLIDQLLHLCVLAIVYSVLTGGSWVTVSIDGQTIGVFALAYLLVLKPTAVFIKIFFNGFGESTDKKSLPLGGTYIGYLERIMIVSFILSGWLEGIGYLLAAKSVFRFGDLRNNKDLKRTEYILLGTFLSFTLAVLIGLLAHGLLSAPLLERV